MSVGALTTTFTPPAACLSSFENAYFTPRAQAVRGPFDATPSCFPSNYEPTLSAYYSPGLCPVGYTSACSSINSIGSIRETAVTCCPTSFICNTRTDYPWQLRMGCTTNFVAVPTTTVITIISDGEIASTTTSSFTGGGYNAYGIQICFQATDFQTTTSTTSLVTSETQAASTSSTTETLLGGNDAPTETTASASSDGDKGLGTGSKAGIAIGSVAGFALLAGCLWMAYAMGRKRRHARAGQEMREASPADLQQASELMGQRKAHQYAYWVPQPPAELESGPYDQGFREMDGSKHHG